MKRPPLMGLSPELEADLPHRLRGLVLKSHEFLKELERGDLPQPLKEEIEAKLRQVEKLFDFYRELAIDAKRLREHPPKLKVLESQEPEPSDPADWWKQD